MGPAAAVGAATVWVVVVAAGLGQRQEQVSDIEGMGPVGCAGDGVSAVSTCVHVRGWWRGCGHNCPATI